MKIIDILTEATILLGLDEEANILQNAENSSETEILASSEKIAKLANLVKFSIRELCTNYVPCSSVIRVKTDEKKYPVGALENFIRVNNVTQNNELVKYKIINRNIVFTEDGEYDVCYSTYPSIMTIFQDIDFLQDFSPDVIVLGLCAYYSLSYGLFEEFEEFHERYLSKAESLKVLRIFDLPCRRWE